MKFKRISNGIKVKGYYYYCTNCNRQLDYYEYLRNDGLCDNCRYSTW